MAGLRVDGGGMKCLKGGFWVECCQSRKAGQGGFGCTAAVGYRGRMGVGGNRMRAVIAGEGGTGGGG